MRILHSFRFNLQKDTHEDFGHGLRHAKASENGAEQPNDGDHNGGLKAKDHHPFGDVIPVEKT
ncbi:hypothetical protein AMTR_s00021p00101440 [Amborella trichopoda]|uniref:Uncharacterized protein n=1 Tax=Amborella trichopoda TaxID=13333 RepID=W1PV47_AMBTC|nr:hypothetical protein AMTR_s00021p00101440 [Amborella trichopoda]